MRTVGFVLSICKLEWGARLEELLNLETARAYGQCKDALSKFEAQVMWTKIVSDLLEIFRQLDINLNHKAIGIASQSENESDKLY